jgi:hypothetical protein
MYDVYEAAKKLYLYSDEYTLKGNSKDIRIKAITIFLYTIAPYNHLFTLNLSIPSRTYYNYAFMIQSNQTRKPCSTKYMTLFLLWRPIQPPILAFP